MNPYGEASDRGWFGTRATDKNQWGYAYLTREGGYLTETY
jgi:hypothetical protein